MAMEILDKVYENLASLREQTNAINSQELALNKLKEKKDKDRKALDTSLSLIGLKIKGCRTCLGTGEESYTYGYQDGSTGYQTCSRCRGTGFEIVSEES